MRVYVLCLCVCDYLLAFYTHKLYETGLNLWAVHFGQPKESIKRFGYEIAAFKIIYTYILSVRIGSVIIIVSIIKTYTLITIDSNAYK